MNYEFVTKFLKIHVGSDDKLWISACMIFKYKLVLSLIASQVM